MAKTLGMKTKMTTLAQRSDPDYDWVDHGPIGPPISHYECNKCWAREPSNDIPAHCESCGWQSRSSWQYLGLLEQDHRYECPCCNQITVSDGTPDQCSHCGRNDFHLLHEIDYYIPGYYSGYY